MTTSPRQAIAKYCKGCTYDPLDKGNWLKQVESCTITDCDLYPHRPVTGKTRRFQHENHLASLTSDQRELAEIRSQIARENMLNFHAAAKAAVSDSNPIQH